MKPINNFKYVVVNIQKQSRNTQQKNAIKPYYSSNNDFTRKKEITKETKLPAILKPILIYNNYLINSNYDFTQIACSLFI